MKNTITSTIIVLILGLFNYYIAKKGMYSEDYFGHTLVLIWFSEIFFVILIFVIKTLLDELTKK